MPKKTKRPINPSTKSMGFKFDHSTVANIEAAAAHLATSKGVPISKTLALKIVLAEYVEKISGKVPEPS